MHELWCQTVYNETNRRVIGFIGMNMFRDMCDSPAGVSITNPLFMAIGNQSNEITAIAL